MVAINRQQKVCGVSTEVHLLLSSDYTCGSTKEIVSLSLSLKIKNDKL
jgi:hypothetical protein